jgi:RNA polymerase sigma factor (sigma-70 family)
MMNEPAVRLMLLDDHASVREALSLLLDRQPDLVVAGEAGSLAEARALMQTTEFDIALVDLDLPDGNGAEIISELRRGNPHARSLVLTGLMDRNAYARAVFAGAAGVLHKSAPLREVLEAIRRLREGRVILAPDEAVVLMRMADEERRQTSAVQEAVRRLTPREREILQLLAEGLSDKEIAARLGLHAKTVRNHMTGILDALDVESRIQALILAARFGVVDLATSPVGGSAAQARTGL